MITAGITAAVAAILSFFGVKPGKYLIGVALVVKGIIVVVGVMAASRVARRLREKEQARVEPAAQTEAPSPTTTADDPSAPPPTGSSAK